MVNARLLVVEDESIVARDIQNRLRNLGYDVPAVVAYGDKAVEKVAELHPDLVLMDIFLKGDMDGIKAAELIRTRYDVPVIFLTAFADPGTLQRAKITEPFGYILKPFEERELLTAIEMALYKHAMERKIKDSQRWLATTLKSVDDAIIATDTAGRIVLMNRVSEALTGWKETEAAGHDIAGVFGLVDDNGQPLPGPVELALQEGAGGQHSQATLIARNGIRLVVECSATPLRDDSDRTSGAVLVFRDITERKAAEMALKANNRHLAIISSITTTINRSDNTRDMLDQVLRDILNLLEIDSGAIYLFETDDASEMKLRAAVSRFEQGRMVRYRQSVPAITTLDPGKIYHSESSHFLHDGSGPGTIMTVPVNVKDQVIGIIALATGGASGHDDSRELIGIGSQLGIALENHRLFRKIQDTSNYLASIINESPDAMLTTDNAGVIASFNRSASRLLAYAPDEVVGKPIGTLLPAGSRLEPGEGKSYVREFKGKDGSLITLNISTSRLYRDGVRSGYVITLKDLSEITGLRVAPVTENAVGTRSAYHFEPGLIYLADKRKRQDYMEVFADQVKHNIQGLCVTRQNPKKIREQYGLEKTPIIWLNSGDVPGESVIKPDNISGLAATIHKFMADAKDGLILLDGMEYLMMRSSYETLLKFVHYLNDRVMQSNSRAIFCIDTQTIDERQLHILMSEMTDLDKVWAPAAVAPVYKPRLPE
jgi:PAS domain S-box-containing protein